MFYIEMAEKRNYNFSIGNKIVTIFSIQRKIFIVNSLLLMYNALWMRKSWYLKPLVSEFIFMLCSASIE